MEPSRKTRRSGLEIAEIGALYKGQWEKKYWSSSRGKEKYPYPVGYKASCCHGGHNYSMEVAEGPRGPMFTVSCEEGLTCSGDTPSIVWDNILKKKHVGAKKVQRRLSLSDVDGPKMFGFTDPTVQRLLHGLVAAADGGGAQDSKKLQVEESKEEVTFARSSAQPRDLISALERSQLSALTKNARALETSDNQQIESDVFCEDTGAKVQNKSAKQLSQELSRQDEDFMKDTETKIASSSKRRRLLEPKVSSSPEEQGYIGKPLGDVNFLPNAGECQQGCSQEAISESKIECSRKELIQYKRRPRPLPTKDLDELQQKRSSRASVELLGNGRLLTGNGRARRYSHPVWDKQPEGRKETASPEMSSRTLRPRGKSVSPRNSDILKCSHSSSQKKSSTLRDPHSSNSKKQKSEVLSLKPVGQQSEAMNLVRAANANVLETSRNLEKDPLRENKLDILGVVQELISTPVMTYQEEVDNCEKNSHTDVQDGAPCSLTSRAQTPHEPDISFSAATECRLLADALDPLAVEDAHNAETSSKQKPMQMRKPRSKSRITVGRRMSQCSPGTMHNKKDVEQEVCRLTGDGLCSSRSCTNVVAIPPSAERFLESLTPSALIGALADVSKNEDCTVAGILRQSSSFENQEGSVLCKFSQLLEGSEDLRVLPDDGIGRECDFSKSDTTLQTISTKVLQDGATASTSSEADKYCVQLSNSIKLEEEATGRVAKELIAQPPELIAEIDEVGRALVDDASPHPPDPGGLKKIIEMPSDQIEVERVLGRTNPSGVATVMSPSSVVDLESDTLVLPIVLGVMDLCEKELEPQASRSPQQVKHLIDHSTAGPFKFIMEKHGVDQVSGSTSILHMSSHIGTKYDAETMQMSVTANGAAKDGGKPADQSPRCSSAQLIVNVDAMPDVNKQVQIVVHPEAPGRKQRQEQITLFETNIPATCSAALYKLKGVTDAHCMLVVPDFVNNEPLMPNTGEGKDSDRETTIDLGKINNISEPLRRRQEIIHSKSLARTNVASSSVDPINVVLSLDANCVLKVPGLVNSEELKPSSEGSKNSEISARMQESDGSKSFQRENAPSPVSSFSKSFAIADTSIRFEALGSVVNDPCVANTEERKEVEETVGLSAPITYGRLNELGVVTVLPQSCDVDLFCDTVEEDEFPPDEHECPSSALQQPGISIPSQVSKEENGQASLPPDKISKEGLLDSSLQEPDAPTPPCETSATLSQLEKDMVQTHLGTKLISNCNTPPALHQPEESIPWQSSKEKTAQASVTPERISKKGLFASHLQGPDAPTFLLPKSEALTTPGQLEKDQVQTSPTANKAFSNINSTAVTVDKEDSTLELLDCPTFALAHPETSGPGQSSSQGGIVQASLSSQENVDKEADSLGQVLTKSMMQLLLPRAVPLMDRGPTKKSKRESTSRPSVHTRIHERGIDETVTDRELCPKVSVGGNFNKIAAVENSDILVTISEKSRVDEAIAKDDLCGEVSPGVDPDMVVVVERPEVLLAYTSRKQGGKGLTRVDHCAKVPPEDSYSHKIVKVERSIALPPNSEGKRGHKGLVKDDLSANHSPALDLQEVVVVEGPNVLLTNSQRNRGDEEITKDDRKTGVTSGSDFNRVVVVEDPGMLLTDSQLIEMMSNLSPKGKAILEIQVKQEPQPAPCEVLDKGSSLQKENSGGDAVNFSFSSGEYWESVIKAQEDHTQQAKKTVPAASAPVSHIADVTPQALTETLSAMPSKNLEGQFDRNLVSGLGDYVENSGAGIAAEIDRRRRRRMSFARLPEDDDRVHETERECMPKWSTGELLKDYRIDFSNQELVGQKSIDEFPQAAEALKAGATIVKIEGERSGSLYSKDSMSEETPVRMETILRVGSLITNELTKPLARTGEDIASEGVVQQENQLDEVFEQETGTPGEVAVSASEAMNLDIGIREEIPDYEGLPSIVAGLGDEHTLSPIGVFEHPAPVLAMFLNVQGTTIHLCVCCGLQENLKRILFVHKLDVQDMEDPKASLLGVIETEFCEGGYNELATEESAMRFTPDGQELILLDCFQLPESSLMLRDAVGMTSPIKSPLTPRQVSSQGGGHSPANKTGRNRGAHCLKVVSYREGIKVRATLKCEQKMQCLLVPGPNTVIAAGDKGCIQCWEMDASWRSYENRSTLPRATYQGESFPSISQLLVAPGHLHLVIGCHYSGSFAIWDYVKGTLLSTCHTPHYSLHRVRILELPSFDLHSISSTISSTCLNDNSATALGFAAKNLLGDLKLEPSCELPLICLLVMASPRQEEFNLYLEESDTLGFEDACATGGQEASKMKCELPGSCRMATLRENRVAIGIPLDIKASAATTFGSYGVIGTTEGTLYVWDIVSGKKVVKLPELEGSPIVCITANPASAVLAAAGDTARVVLYL